MNAEFWHIVQDHHWALSASAFLSLALSAILVTWMLRYRRLFTGTMARGQRYKETIENLAEGFYRSSIEGKQLRANAALVRLNGYDNEEELLAAVNNIACEWYVDPNRREEFKQALERDGFVTNFVSEIYRHKTRERIWISENARIVYDTDTGEPAYYEGSVREITAEIEVGREREKLEKLSRNLPGGLFQFVLNSDGSYNVAYASDGFGRLLGLSGHYGQITPQKYTPNIHKDDRAQYLTRLQSSAVKLTHWNCEFRYFPEPGKMIWLNVSATPERQKCGAIVWHGHLSDITERKQAERRIEKMAYVDALTQLPNRRMFTDRLGRAIGDSRRESQHGAVLFIDLDNFKALNDTHGHDVGDELLRQVAARLSDSVRAADLVSRFGGDEFVILLERLGDDHEDALARASGAANKILREFVAPFDLSGVLHSTTPSIGVAVFDDSAEPADDILKSADLAMYEAKKSGRNGYVLFDPAGLKRVSESFELQRELSSAIAQGQLQLYYQPQIDAGRRIVGAEALVRWDHPRLGLLTPGAFVPMAEKTGLIALINEWVLDQAIQTLERWRDDPHLNRQRLSVNLSVQQFRSPNFATDFCTRIAESGVDGGLLTLELTEHVMAYNPKQVAGRMAELKDAGIQMSLDDFGTGYSSLSQLNQFPFDEVKIDGAFISRLDERTANRTLVEAILGLAGAFGLRTVAEHVSSEAQLAFLRQRGCNLFQGYFFYEPLEEAQFRARVAEQTDDGSSRQIA